MTNSHPLLAAFCLLAAVSFLGCGEQEDFRFYETDPGVKPVTFNTPEGWRRAGTNSSFGELYAWEKGTDDEKIRVNVSFLDSEHSDLLKNINRWRVQQLGLQQDWTQSELEDQIEDLEINGFKGLYVELIGPEPSKSAASPHRPKLRQAIFGAIIPAQGRTWFLKLRGPLRLVEQEKEIFKTWLPGGFRAVLHAVREPVSKESSNGD